MRAVPFLLCLGTGLFGPRLLAAQQAPAGAQQGEFEFRFQLPTGLAMQGRLTITPDTILVVPTAGSDGCLPAPSRREQIVYRCTIGGTGEVLLLLHRSSPLTRSTAEIRVTVDRSRRVCTLYDTDENGRQVCVLYEEQTFIEERTRRERIELKPVGTPGQP